MSTFGLWSRLAQLYGTPTSTGSPSAPNGYNPTQQYAAPMSGLAALSGSANPQASQPPPAPTSGGSSSSPDYLGLAKQGVSAANKITQGGNTSALADIGNALSIYGGIKQGGVLGDTTAAVNAAQLASKLGFLPSAVGSTVGAVAPGLGLYSGIKQGGVAGDAQAAASAAQLASTGAQAAGYGATAAGTTLSNIADVAGPASAFIPFAMGALGMSYGPAQPIDTTIPDTHGSIATGGNAIYKDPTTGKLKQASSPADLGWVSDGNGGWIWPIGKPWPKAYPGTPDTYSQGAAGEGGGSGARPVPKSQGGNVKSSNVRGRLKKLSEGSSVSPKRHYAEGDSVDYFTPDIPSDYSGSYVSDQYTQPAVDYGTPTLDNPGSGLSDETASLTNSDAVVNIGNTPGLNNSVLNQGGALSGLGSALGVSSLGQLLKQYGALAPILAAALGKNKPASAPATPAGYGAIPSIPTPSYSRPYTQPNVANWYTYGEGPEQSFFGNNQLPTIPGVSPPASQAPAAPASSPPATGQMTTQPVGMAPPPVLRARGGAFNSMQGDTYVSDPGHGDGTSDDIDAKLSGGEYVMDAGTVSMLGNGSNEAGSRALDQLRQRVRKHAGKQLVKGKQFMKAKPPETYLRAKEAT